MYDDTEREGDLRVEAQTRSVDTFLAGKRPPKDSIATAHVVYHLREGSEGQLRIARKIRKELKLKPDVSITHTSAISFPRVSLDGPDEKILEDNPFSLYMESEITTTASATKPQLNEVRATAMKGLQASKQQLFPDIYNDGATDIVSIHSDQKITGRVGVEDASRNFKKLAQRLSLASSDVQSTQSINFFRCRCGFEEEIADWELDQHIIRCDSLGGDDCARWSHAACQPDGWTHFITPEEKFYCPSCEAIEADPSQW